MKQVYPAEDAKTQRARELAEEDRYDLLARAVVGLPNRRSRADRSAHEMWWNTTKE
jgi:hypothetical protein